MIKELEQTISQELFSTIPSTDPTNGVDDLEPKELLLGLTMEVC